MRRSDDDDAQAMPLVTTGMSVLQRWGALVIKVDNGSEFVGEGSNELHGHWGVERLRSPADLLSYHRACASVPRCMRYRAEMLGRRDGKPGQWSLDHRKGARA